MFSFRPALMLLAGVIAVVLSANPVFAQQQLEGSFTLTKNGDPVTTTDQQGNVWEVGTDILPLPGPSLGEYYTHTWVRKSRQGRKIYVEPPTFSITYFYPTLLPWLNLYTFETHFNGEVFSGLLVWEGDRWVGFVNDNVWTYTPE